MATPPRAPRVQSSTGARTVTGAQAVPLQALLMEQPNQSKASVEIETMSRGIPKVKVRVNDDDPQTALELALSLYFDAVSRLEAPAEDTAETIE